MRSLFSFPAASVSEEDHGERACFICVLLSHGGEGTLFGTDRPVPLQQLTSSLTAERCPSLKGKPKLFFIQVQNTPTLTFTKTRITVPNSFEILGQVKSEHVVIQVWSSILTASVLGNIYNIDVKE